MTHGAASRRAVAAAYELESWTPASWGRSAPTRPDATVENHASLALVRWHTDAARDWIHENVSNDAQYFGAALVVEPRYVAQLVEGMIGAGLVIA